MFTVAVRSVLTVFVCDSLPISSLISFRGPTGPLFKLSLRFPPPKRTASDGNRCPANNNRLMTAKEEALIWPLQSNRE